MQRRKEILSIKNLSKGFPGVQALDTVSFSLEEGEIHCLVGENGAGKSTFIKILSGGLAPDGGEITLFGNKHSRLTPQQSISMGIQTVYQESILVDTISVGENIFLGNEKVAYANIFSLKKTNEEAQQLIDSLNMNIDAKRNVEELSTAERQIVGIIKAFSRKAKILILDEPTASLSYEESSNLISLLKQMSKNNVSIIYISHHLEEIYQLADRITVIKDGKYINTHKQEDIDHSVIVKEMVGRPANLFYKRDKINNDTSKIITFEVANITTDLLKDISFSVKSGEIFGIGGMVGSGRTELLRSIFGLDSRKKGKISLNGKDISARTPYGSIQNGMCLLTEDRKKTGLILTRSVRENTTIAKVTQSKQHLISLKAEQASVEKIVNTLRIITPSIEQEVKNLSGGNQQKVVLAKWLLTDARIILFDEPTRGVDIGAKEEIYKLMVELANNNKIVILVSSDMPELIAMSDRIGVMRDGAMITILENEKISEENILHYSIGMENKDES
jgi:ribose transport system ATP-binding protein